MTWSAVAESVDAPTSFVVAVSSVDELVCAQQYRLWNRDANRLRGFQIHDELQLPGLLHRKIAWLRAFEDLVHVDRGLPVISVISYP